MNTYNSKSPSSKYLKCISGTTINLQIFHEYVSMVIMIIEKILMNKCNTNLNIFLLL